MKRAFIVTVQVEVYARDHAVAAKKAGTKLAMELQLGDGYACEVQEVRDIGTTGEVENVGPSTEEVL